MVSPTGGRAAAARHALPAQGLIVADVTAGEFVVRREMPTRSA
jgi:hypothetical protein